MTSIYPKLPGLPTKPGWYWRVLGDDDEPEPYFVSESTVQWYASDCGPSEFTWYGPIPEPPTGEREPCCKMATVRLTLPELSHVRSLVDRNNETDGCYYGNREQYWRRHARIKNKLAEARKRIETITGGTDHA